MVGNIEPSADGWGRLQDNCGGVTHVNNTLKNLATFKWTAPSTPGTGPLQLWAMLVQCKMSCSPAYNFNAYASLAEAIVASPTPAASPSAVSPSATASATATSSVSASFGASASSSATATASGTQTATSTATASPSIAASATAAPTMAAYPSATALSAAVTLQWRLEDANGQLASASTATQAAFLLSGQGNVWLGMARAQCNGMINRAQTGGCSGPAAIGLPASGAVQQSVLGGKTVSAISQVPQASYTLTSARAWYDAAAGLSYAAFKRPLAASGDPSELPINATASTGLIWAVGSSAAFAYHASYGYAGVVLSPPACSRNGSCSGHGSCVVAESGSTEACVCDVGYAGAACSSCDLGFAPVGGVKGAVCTPEPAALVTDVAVAVTIRLNLAFSSAGLPGSQQRGIFVSALQSEIAGALGVSLPRVNITSVQPGSIIATFALLPPQAAASGGASPSPSPTAAASPSPVQLSAPALAVRFAALFADTSSPLYAGNITSSIDTATPPAFVPFASGSAAAFKMRAALRPDLTLSWTTAGSLVRMQLAYSGGSGGWFAFGINDRAGMTGGDVMLFQPGAAAGSQAQQYTITAESAAGVQRVASAVQPLSGVVISRSASGAVTVEWTRPLAAGSYTGARAIPATGSVSILWAVGDSGQATLARHSASGAGTATLDFSTGALTASAAASMRVAHGVMMTLAWGVLAPVGVMLARFAKSSPNKPCGKPLWFQSHRTEQSCAVLLSLIGLGIAIAMVQQAGSAHFGSAHGALGLTVVLLGVLQPVNAAFRPNPPKAGEARSAARLLWEIIHRIGGYSAVAGGAVAIFLGLAGAGAAVGFSIAYGLAILAPLLLFSMGRERRGCRARLTASASTFTGGGSTRLLAVAVPKPGGKDLLDRQARADRLNSASTADRSAAGRPSNVSRLSRGSFASVLPDDGGK